jgi:hypothetical protein
MRLGGVAVAWIACAGAALAEMRDERISVGEHLVRIEVVDRLEVLKVVGPSAATEVQVLSGADIEIVALFADPDSIGLLGQPTLVVEVTGTHSCDNLAKPRAYHVVTPSLRPVSDGPLTTCVDLTVSATPGALVLEEDPMGEGEAWIWMPGQGFGAVAN